ncbi:MAG: hypothetical protein CMI71_03140 [Candidatus Pelagibacter sp.]|nr:hypothetical protein [Candidatus Pelagibacter sp.]
MKKYKIYSQILSCFCFSLLGLQIKILLESLPTESIVFFRFLIGSFIVLFLLLITKQKIYLSKNFLIHLLRSFFGVFATYFGYKTLTYITLSQATTIGFTKVFFASIFASIIFKERFLFKYFILILIGFFGVLVITGPITLQNHGIYYGLISAMCVSGGIISISFLVKKDSSFTVIFYHSIISTIIFFLIFHQRISFNIIDHLFPLLLITITALAGQYFNAESYKDNNTNLIVILSYLRIIFSTALGFFFLNEEISFYTILGIVLIVISTIYVKKEIIK